MAYQKFQKIRKNQLPYPAVSISKGGDFTINERCLEQYTINEDYTCVELYYDDVAEKIGIKPLKKETMCSCNLNRKSNTKYGIVHGAAFLKHFGLTSSTKTLHAAKWNKKSKLIELDLKIPSDLPIPKPKAPNHIPKTTPTAPKEKSVPTPPITGHGKDLEL